MSSKTSKSTKPKRSKSKRGHNKKVSKIKVVVRRLPPLIPKELFFDSVKQWITEETCTWSRFHQGRISKSKNKESIFSRAYFYFKNVDQVLEFHRGYDSHLFIDRQGNENRAVVEFAVYQKLPKEHKKLDIRQGTIETDPDYLAFLESLKVEEIQRTTAKEPSVALESGTTQLERLEARLANSAITSNVVEKPTTTPLLEHLRALKLGPKSKSPPPKHILSPPGLSAKGGSRSAKQPQQSRATNEASQFQSSRGPRRERKKRERERERREKEREKREKDKEKDKKNGEENEKDKGKEPEELNEKSKEKTKEQGKEKENYRERERERRREKRFEKEKQRSIRERERKSQATEASKSEPPAITIVPRPQTQESKAEAKEKEKETKRAPVKITIQQRQKEQIRQIIQKTNLPTLPKKELNTTENDSKEEPAVKESAETKGDKEENKGKDPEASVTSPSERNSTSNTSNASSNEYRHRRRERNRKHSVDVKTPQIQILTKPQTQPTNTSESNVDTSTSSAASSSTAATSSTGPPQVRRSGGRGYFGKRGGRGNYY